MKTFRKLSCHHTPPVLETQSGDHEDKWVPYMNQYPGLEKLRVKRVDILSLPSWRKCPTYYTYRRLVILSVVS